MKKRQKGEGFLHLPFRTSIDFCARCGEEDGRPLSLSFLYRAALAVAVTADVLTLFFFHCMCVVERNSGVEGRMFFNRHDSHHENSASSTTLLLPP